MKTAISIPDQTFDAAEQLVKRLGISRSELYSKAISSYIKEHRNDSVTEALNEIYADEDKMNLMLNSWKFQF
jgi:metal-responsive CopG/Arc/MetJ family transcriptional regulator